tara:strand:- start:942 stop:1373 length:432 start_codon:yes stop_codon:yes gene_type:complete
MIYFIYKLQVNDDIYIGSTNCFEKRMYDHKSKTMNGHHYRLYKTIRENGGWDIVDCQVLLKYECENRIQAIMKEEEFRKVYNACLNTKKAYTTKEELNEYYSKWRETNRDKQNEQLNCLCGGRYTKCNYTHHLNSKKHINYLK